MQAVASRVPETKLESELRDVQTAIRFWQHMAASPAVPATARQRAQEQLRNVERRMFGVLNQLGSELRSEKRNEA